MELAIATVGLTKSFAQKSSRRQAVLNRLFRRPQPPITAVDRVDLEVRRGELFGLLGPNGAGKTTLVKMLCTLILPDTGRATVNGFDLADEDRVRGSIGLAGGEERSFYWRLTGRQNLAFFAALHGLSREDAQERIRRLTDLLELGEFLDRRFDRCSSGMKQRLGIARGMLNEPKVLFLDEPTRSLDPASAAHLRRAVRDLVERQGYTVVLVTHHLHEAEELCDRVAIMQKGRIRVSSDVAGLRRLAGAGRRYRVSLSGCSAELAESLGRLPGMGSFACDRTDPQLTVVGFGLDGPARDGPLAALIDLAVRGGARVVDVVGEEPSLEDIFMQYTREGP